MLELLEDSVQFGVESIQATLHSTLLDIQQLLYHVLGEDCSGEDHYDIQKETDHDCGILLFPTVVIRYDHKLNIK